MARDKRAREPVQAYLDDADSQLLAQVSRRAAVSKAEVIRLGIRRLAQDLRIASRPFAGLDALEGALHSADDVPADLAANHDAYLYGDRKPAKTRRR